MLIRSVSFVLLLILGTSWLACNPQESALIVRVLNWPIGASSLRVLSSFAGTRGKTEIVELGISEFTIIVPMFQAGTLATLAIDAVAQDSNNCDLAEGAVDVDFSKGAAPSIRSIDLALNAFTSARCPPSKNDGENCSQVPADSTCKSGCCLPMDNEMMNSGSVCTVPHLQVWQDFHPNCRFIFLDGADSRVSSDVPMPNIHVLKSVPSAAVSIGITDCAPPGFGIQGVYNTQTQSKTVNTSSCKGSWIVIGTDMVLRCIIGNQ